MAVWLIGVTHHGLGNGTLSSILREVGGHASFRNMYQLHPLTAFLIQHDLP